MNAAPQPERRATLSGLLAILLWASLALLTTLTGSLPPFHMISSAVSASMSMPFCHVRRLTAEKIGPSSPSSKPNFVVSMARFSRFRRRFVAS